MRGGIIILYNQVLSETEQLKQKIANIQNELLTLPEGKLICAQNGTGQKWYQSNGHTKVYIPKKNRRLTEQLLTSPKYQDLLAPYFTPQSLALTEWMNDSYERNPLHPEQCIHKSISGNLLRSKSEAMIDMFLHLNKIPFRYECALHLDETTLYPDFTIRHPYSQKIYYWEHFGLMDSSAYAQNAYSKLQLYTSHNLIPSIQLITTFETKEQPLNAKIIENIIDQYFL